MKNWPKYRKNVIDNVILSINEDDLAGYCGAVGVTHCFSTSHSQNELMSAVVSDKVYISILDKYKCII